MDVGGLDAARSARHGLPETDGLCTATRRRTLGRTMVCTCVCVLEDGSDLWRNAAKEVS